MGAQIGVGDPARHLARMLPALADKGKYRLGRVAGLYLQLRVVDAAPVQSGWRSGFQPPHGELDFLQPFGQGNCRRIAKTSGPVVLQADMHQPIQESPGGQNHGWRLEAHPQLGYHSDDAIAGENQVVGCLLKQRQAGLVFQALTDSLAIELAVGLGAGGSYRRPLGCVQCSKLDSRLVGSHSHRPAQGIDFLHKVAFADSANRGIA
jgi:hypothetical protein